MCLSGFVSLDTSVGAVDAYQVMRGVGRVERVLGLGARARFDGMGGR